VLSLSKSCPWDWWKESFTCSLFAVAMSYEVNTHCTKGTQ